MAVAIPVATRQQVVFMREQGTGETGKPERFPVSPVANQNLQ